MVSIIILNYNNSKQTIEAVQSSIRQQGNNNIIIVDNNSTDNSFDILQEEFSKCKNVFVIQSGRNNGYSYGNNIGIKFAKSIDANCKYICIMNPDIILVDTNSLLNLITNMEKYNLDGITGFQINKSKLDFNMLAWKLPSIKDLIMYNSGLIKKLYNPIAYKSININKDGIGDIEVMPGCFFIINYNKFKEIGFFDEKVFLYYEENILSIKARNKKYRFGISVKDLYIHNHITKEESLQRLNEKMKHKNYSFKSQRYFAREYLNANVFERIFLVITQIINKYIEIPFKYYINKIKR